MNGYSARWTLLGLLALAGTAQATAADDLLEALKLGRTLEARGEVQVTVWFPPREVPSKTVNKLPLLSVRPALLTRNFDVLNAGPETLAGRPVTRYDLRPRNTAAAGWRIWIDQQWQIPLAFEERAASGDLSRQAIFRKVNPAAVQVRRPLPAPPVGLRTALQAALPGLQLPAGFVPVGVVRSGERWEVALSDGLNTLALVTAPRNVKAAPGVVSRKVGPRFVWLIGNLPPETMRRALAPIKQLQEEGLGTFLAASSSNP